MKVLYIAICIFFLGIPSISFGSLPELIDRGKGEVRYLGFIKVYEANLLTTPKVTRSTVLNPDSSRCLVLDYAVSLSAEDLIEGGETVLNKQHDKQKLDKIRNHIDTLHSSYQDVSSGDSYSLCYNSANNITTLSYNSEEVVNIESSEFANVYFGIWLGPKSPISDDLRDDLLKNLPKD